jgi:hypothetical protein
LLSDFLSFWTAASDDDRRRLWEELYEAKHADVFDLYYDGFGNRDRLDEALALLAPIVGTLTGRGERLHAALDELGPACLAQVGLVERELPSVVFVGLFASNAWVTDFQGEPTTFFALECFPEAPHDRILVAHELAHQVHELARAGDWSDSTVLLRLFEEGIATVLSELVVPGHTVGEYLWFDDGFDDWVARCAARRAEICAALLDDQNGMRLFALRGGEERAGYFAAREVALALLDDFGLPELARWSPAEADRVVRELLLSLAER